MRSAMALSLCLAVLPQEAAGQERYLPQTDSIFVLLVNPYRMYWVRGGDTLSQPMHEVSVEAQRWDRDGQDLRVAVRQLLLNVHRRSKVDTFTVTSLGAVERINGHAPGLNERIDLVLRLPRRALVTGLTWADTLRSLHHSGPSQDGLYSVTRDYRVSRVFDSAGTRLGEVSATGVVHYRDSWWMDSTAGTFASIDVTGPDTERFVFDIRQGRLLSRYWSMNLTGQGTIPSDSGRIDTTAAGLISAMTQVVVAPDRAHLLLRPLPGLDTSMTVDGGPVLVHTVRRESREIEAGMARNDGMVGTVHARFAGGLVESYEALWTDTAAAARQLSLTMDGDSLRIHEPGRTDTTVGIPERWWGVGDYAMNELLVPTFLAHPADGVAAPFAVYRPYPRHWDVGTASLRPLGENYVATYRLGSDTLPTLLLITKEGDLLLAQNSGPTGAHRVPSEGSSRSAQLEEILRTLPTKR